MTRMLSHRHALALAACLAILAVPRLAAQQDTKQQSAAAPTTVSAKAISEQLGARLQPRDDDELRVGMSFTAVLESPEKLAEFGVKGMHAGARVTVGRIAPDKVRIEADEMMPVTANGAATVKLDSSGRLVAPVK